MVSQRLLCPLYSLLLMCFTQTYKNNIKTQLHFLVDKLQYFKSFKTLYVSKQPLDSPSFFLISNKGKILVRSHFYEVTSTSVW